MKTALITLAAIVAIAVAAFSLARKAAILNERAESLRGEIIKSSEELAGERVTPIKGSDVFLTIDVQMQNIVETALRDGGVGRGAAVMMDPQTGEVLAMASVPFIE